MTVSLVTTTLLAYGRSKSRSEVLVLTPMACTPYTASPSLALVSGRCLRATVGRLEIVRFTVLSYFLN
jgi:hypothetical protein